jgi:hypothetical protein
MSNEWQTFVEERARELAMEKEEVPYGYHNLREFCEQARIKQLPYFDVRETNPNATSELDAQLKHYWKQTQGGEK